MEVIDGEKVVTNDKGMKLVLRGGAWVPYIPKAGSAPSWWERNIKPLQTPAAEAMAMLSGAPMADEKNKILPTGIEKFAANQIVPDSATDAALNALMLAMPEGKALEAFPPPIRALLRSRLGRIGTMTGLGAGIGAATGEGAGTGAFKGGVGQTGAEIASPIIRRVTEGNEAARYASNLGKTIKEQFPFLANSLERIGNKLETPADFDAAFKSGRAMQDMSRLLDETKAQVKSAVGNQPIFANVLNPNSTHPTMLPRSKAFSDLVRDNMREAQELGIRFDPKFGYRPTFEQADALITRARGNAYRLESGVGKDSAVGARIRRNADSALDDLKSNLNRVAPGIGDIYRDTQGKWSEANDIARLFSKPGVIEGGKLRAQQLQEQAMETGNKGFRRQLESSPSGKKLLKDIFRGAEPTGTAHARGKAHLRFGVWPMPAHVYTNIPAFGTKRVGKEAVQLYHGIPAIAAKAIAEQLQQGNF
jgi:hypothetical protein